MVKLKRMLGDIDDPTVVVLMALIESQSAETLANWKIISWYKNKKRTKNAFKRS